MNQNEPNKVGLDRNYNGYYNTINRVLKKCLLLFHVVEDWGEFGVFFVDISYGCFSCLVAYVVKKFLPFFGGHVVAQCGVKVWVALVDGEDLGGHSVFNALDQSVARIDSRHATKDLGYLFEPVVLC